MKAGKLAKDWRGDRYLRRLEALLLVVVSAGYANLGPGAADSRLMTCSSAGLAALAA